MVVFRVNWKYRSELLGMNVYPTMSKKYPMNIRYVLYTLVSFKHFSDNFTFVKCKILKILKLILGIILLAQFVID